MALEKVTGRNNRHKVLVYSLSTCVHCKAAKQFLRENDLEFEYIDVDLCSKKDQQKILSDIQKRGGIPSFPKIIIDYTIMITGLDKNKIHEALEN